MRLLWALIAQHSNPSVCMKIKTSSRDEAFVGADRAALEPQRLGENKNLIQR
jgi:hypothetical protein